MEVGFLGTGRMGKVMAANLLKAGHRVRAWDKSPEPLHELKRAGADIATTAADAFLGDAVISMLPNDQALRDVFIEAICSNMVALRPYRSTWGPFRLIASTPWSPRMTPATFPMSRRRCSDGPTWRRPPSSALWRPETRQRSTVCNRC